MERSSMRYLCLRDCFVDSRLWRSGEVYDLHDSMQKAEKNFRPLDAPKATEAEPVVTEGVTPNVELVEDAPIKTTDDFYTCNACGKQFKNKLGLTGHMRSHMKEKTK